MNNRFKPTVSHAPLTEDQTTTIISGTKDILQDLIGLFGGKKNNQTVSETPAKAAEKDNTLLYIGIGGGALLLIILILVVALKK